MTPIKKPEQPESPLQSDAEDYVFAENLVERLQTLFNKTVLPRWDSTFSASEVATHVLFNNYVRDLGGEFCRAIEVFNRVSQSSGFNATDIKKTEDQCIERLKQIRELGQNVIDRGIEGAASSKRVASIAHVVNCAQISILNIKGIA